MTPESWSLVPLPAETVAAVRMAVSPLTDDVLAAVSVEHAAYADVLGGPEGLGLRLGIEQAIKAFLDAVARGEHPVAEAGEVWRRLGEAEFQAGRSLDDLRGAFRTGTRAVWRGAAALAGEAGVSSAEVATLAEGIFVFADELTAEVVEGYLQVQSNQAGERERRRRRLASLLLDAEQHEPEALERAASLANWRMPREVAVLAFAAEAPVGLARLDADVLVGADELGGWLLVPDPSAPGRAAELAHAVNGLPAALGPAVALNAAPRSLRWARLALSLLQSGVLPGARGLRRTSDHLGSLVLLQDMDLARELVASRLAALDAQPGGDQERLIETLSAWLAHQRHTPSIAAALHVHPQTVRYRMAKLRELLGETLDTADGRFELELALRARAALAVVAGGAGR